MEFTIFYNLERKEFFFSTDYCQGLFPRAFYRTNIGSYYQPDPRPVNADSSEDASIWEELNETCSPLDSSWISYSFSLPARVAPRRGLEDGRIETLSQYIKVFHSGDVLVPNPDTLFEPTY
jgi:hypothetical protein